MFYLFCNNCFCRFVVAIKNGRHSNGAIIRKYQDGTYCLKRKCKKCYRDEKNSNPIKCRKYCNKYEKTKNGFLMRLYRNMKSRVYGVQYKKAHLYKGLEILEKTVFYKWANDSKLFHDMFSEWEESGYDRKLTPTVDRVDSSKGYILENMRWLTHSDNSRNISRK